MSMLKNLSHQFTDEKMSPLQTSCLNDDIGLDEFIRPGVSPPECIDGNHPWVFHIPAFQHPGTGIQHPSSSSPSLPSPSFPGTVKEAHCGEDDKYACKNVSETAVKRQRGIPQGYRALQDRFGKEITFTLDDPRRCDKGAEAGVGGPYHRSVGFDCSKNGHTQMLVRGAGPAEPCVVGNVYKDIGPVPCKCSSQFREDRLKTDQDPHGKIARLECL